MSALELARLQFAATASLHFLFVVLTLGLVLLVALTQTRYVITGNPVYGRMTRFWGLLYVINYAVGIATGLVMEFQLGLNWSGLSKVTGDVFGAPLALETLVAFVLESTLLGMWIFGWGRLSKGLHLGLIWGVALTAYLSAFWVMVANAFLQHPVGFTMDGAGRARLESFGALLGNQSLWFALGHVVSVGVLTGGLFMAGVTAWHVLRGRAGEGGPDTEFHRRSLRTGVWAAFIGSTMTIGFGFAQFAPVGDTQPTKLAGGDEALRHQAAFVAKYGPGDYLPPEWIHVALGVMIEFGNLLNLAMLIFLVLLTRDVLLRKRWARPLLRVLVGLIPVPFALAVAGWMVREVGRQPWAVYGLLKVEDAVSPMSASALTASAAGFSALLVGLVLVDWWLLARHARRGPGEEFLPQQAAPEKVEAFA